MFITMVPVLGYLSYSNIHRNPNKNDDVDCDAQNLIPIPGFFNPNYTLHSLTTPN